MSEGWIDSKKILFIDLLFLYNKIIVPKSEKALTCRMIKNIVLLDVKVKMLITEL